VQNDGPSMVQRVLVADFSNGEKCVRREVGTATPKEMLAFLQFVESLKEVLSVKQSVKAGDMVRVKFGPMEGKLAQVQSVKGHKVNLLIELFKVEVKADAIQLEDNTTTASNSLHKESKSGTRLNVRRGPISAAGGQSRL
jgi:transcription antitermination factor NusG